MMYIKHTFEKLPVLQVLLKFSRMWAAIFRKHDSQITALACYLLHDHISVPFSNVIEGDELESGVQALNTI